jgi:hypothetical protein
LSAVRESSSSARIRIILKVMSRLRVAEVWVAGKDARWMREVSVSEA